MAQLVRQEDPLNTEPYSKKLADSFITPNDLVFNRNHDSIVNSATPTSSDDNWTLTISVDQDVDLDGAKATSQSRSLDALRKDFDLIQVLATLECAGNRRAELASSHRPAEGIQWGNAVIANVVWGGASLRQVLLAAGVPDPFGHHADLTQLEPSESASHSDAATWARTLHLHLFSAQESTESDDPTRKEYFAASIPFTTAMHPNQGCLLAYQYNREPLTQRHGAPLRAVIPGHVGARWVKWLNGLKISTRENDSPPMRQDYKLLTPANHTDTQQEEQAYAQKAADPAFRKRELGHQKPLQRLEASCSITQPSKDGQPLQVDDTGNVTIKGYAVGQDGSPATQVWLALVPESTQQSTSSEELLTSLPKQPEWKQAQIPHNPLDSQFSGTATSSKWSWAWTLWQLQLPAPSVEENQQYALIARCVTASGVEQQKISEWNLRGFCNRSWSVVRNVSIQPASPS